MRSMIDTLFSYKSIFLQEKESDRNQRKNDATINFIMSHTIHYLSFITRTCVEQCAAMFCIYSSFCGHEANSLILWKWDGGVKCSKFNIIRH